MDPVPSDNTDLLTAILAGATSGAVEAIGTYPFEYYKTTTQIENAARMITLPDEVKTFKALYTGCGALAIGNSLKAATRMCIFNSASAFMQTDSGQTTAPRVVVAGMMTGFLETLWVIPFENIKTRTIQNSMFIHGMKMREPEAKKPLTATNIKKPQNMGQSSGVKTAKRPSTQKEPVPIPDRGPKISSAQLKAIEYYAKNPQTSLRGVIKEMYVTQGLRGFKQGSIITIFRQCMNSMVWFSSYTSAQQMLDPNRDSTTELEMIGMGFASSCAVVAVTQPIDLVKTRMQTKDYAKVYRDVMTCVYRTFAEEGVRKFWSGWLPRLLKVSVSSSVTLFTYDFTVNGINKLKGMKPFSAS